MKLIPGARNNFGDVLSNGVTHKGLDMRAPDASGAVVSPEKGVVVAVWTNDLTAPFVGYGPGGMVIRGDSGVFHLLAHLDPVQIIEAGVKNGQRFDEGEQVGLISKGGPKGDGTPTKFWQGPHLHWEVRQPSSSTGPFGQNGAINPLSWLAGKVEGFGIEWWVWLLIGLALTRRR